MSLIEIIKTSKRETDSKRRRKNYEINAFVEGKGVIYTSETSFFVENNCISIFKPEKSYTLSGGPFIRYSITAFPQILTKFEREVFKLLSSSPIIKLPQKSFSRILDVAKNMHDLKHTDKHREEMKRMCETRKERRQ